MLEELSEEFDITSVTEQGKEKIKIFVAKEMPVTIILNDQELVTLLSSPQELDCLAIGFLVSEGFLHDKNEIQRVLVDQERGIVRVNTSVKVEMAQEKLFKRLITSGCGRGASFYSAADIGEQKVTSEVIIKPGEIFNLMLKFQKISDVYKATHGVHGAALCTNNDILIFCSDVGRHNAVDRVIGKCILEGIDSSGHILLSSGRVSSEILHKIVRADIPVIVSITAPTNLGVKIAQQLGVTLVGRVLGQHRMLIYTNPHRIAEN